MAFKIPGIIKTAVDPLDLGYGDAIFGKSKGPDYSQYTDAQKAALAKGQAATDKFEAGGPATYDAGTPLAFQQLATPESQQATGLADITTDPRYRDAELQALSELQDTATNGLTARDKADLAEENANVSAANRGRLGAIRQQMNARGASGSGLDLVAQMQSAQDSAQTEALRALETEAASEQNRQNASAQLGSLGSSLQQQQYNQAANAAAAQDAINRFNTDNMNGASQYNNQGVNNAASANWQRQNNTSDNNNQAQYQYNKDSLGAEQNQSGLNYNSATEGLNGAKLEDQQKAQAASDKLGAVAGIGGAIIGGIYGGSKGAAVGSQVAGGLGKTVGSTAYKNSYAHGGTIPGHARYPGDDPRNDTEQVRVSAGEVVLPRSVARDPKAAAKFVDEQNEDDAIGHLLQALSAIHKGKK